MLSHEDTSTTVDTGAFLTQTGNLTVVINTVVLEDGEGDLLALVLNLLGGGVSLLLLLFGTTTETEDQMKGGFLLNVVVRKGTTVFKLLTSEDQTLLIRGNTYKFKRKNIKKRIELVNKSSYLIDVLTLLILNFQFNILNGVAGFDFQSNGLAGQGLDEDLHDENFFIAGVTLDSIYSHREKN